MKAVGKCLLILLLIVGGVGGYIYYKDYQNKQRLEEIKKGWYVEIIKEYINVRESADSYSDKLGEVKMGEIYQVIEVDTETDPSYYWYKISYKNKEAWIASGKKKHWVKDYNNPIDIAIPIIKFYEDVYSVATIEDINYKHLEVIEDSDDYQITHKVYHEVKPYQNIDQYWILYTITDGSGKSSSKMQKIEFAIKPDESQVLDFNDYRAY